MRKTLTALSIVFVFILSSCSATTITKASYNKSEKILTVSGSGELSGAAVRSKKPEAKKFIHLEAKNGFTSVAEDGFNAKTDKLNNNIQTVTFPDSLKTIGSRAFYNCKSFRDLKLPGNIAEIGGSAFENCDRISNQVFPAKLKKIGERAFAACDGINRIEFGASTKEIEKEAFKNCKSLFYVMLNKTLSKIGERAFENCSKLIIINIPGNVKIGNKAFYNCKKLSGVVISDTVKTIGEKSFGYYTDNGVEKKVKDFIVKGKKNSAAYKYALKNGFKFVESKTAGFNIDLNIKKVSYKKLPQFGYLDAFYILNDKIGNYTDNYGYKNDEDITYKYVEYLFNELNDDYANDSDSVQSDYEYYKKFLLYDYLDAGKYSAEIPDKITSRYRKSGDFLISDYKDGVCINKYIYNKKKFDKYKKGKEYPYKVKIDIPAEIDGKKVLKLGEFLEKEKMPDGSYMPNEYDGDEYVSKGFLTTVPDEFRITLKIPATVTDITSIALDSIDNYEDGDDFFYSNGYITDIEVDANNPLYCSENGVMYSKDKKWLLFFRPDDYDELKGGKPQVFTVPDSVEYIADTNLCETRIDPDYTLVLGKNIKKIYAVLSQGECGTYSCTFKPAKGSYAEKWVKKNTNM